MDGCYSFWVGALVPLIGMSGKVKSGSVIDMIRLQEYILSCCQNNEYGGLRDKPSKYFQVTNC